MGFINSSIQDEGDYFHFENRGNETLNNKFRSENHMLSETFSDHPEETDQNGKGS